MDKKELVECLEAYRDGRIEREQAEKLAWAIRQGGEEAELILEELTFSGWIKQALESLDEDTFVRSFIERLYAEDSSEAFSTSFLNRINQAAAEDRMNRARAKSEKWGGLRGVLHAVFGTRVEGASDVESDSGKRKPAFLSSKTLGVVTACVITLGIGLIIGLMTVNSSSEKTAQRCAQVEQVSEGVILRRGKEPRNVERGAVLQEGDSLAVPLEGYANVDVKGNGEVSLSAGSVALFRPKKLPVEEVISVKTPAVFLQNGKITVSNNAEQLKEDERFQVVVASPHGTVKPLSKDTEFSMSVTATSTRVGATKGKVTATRYADEEKTNVEAGSFVVVSNTGELTPHKSPSEESAKTSSASK